MTQNLPVGRSEGRGSILVIVLVVVIAVLVIAGLILPPIALPSRLGLLGPACRTLSARNPSLDHPDGLTVSIDADTQNTLALRLASFPQDEPSNNPLSGALKALPKSYRAKGPLFQIDACGTRAVPSTLTVAIPEGAEPWETLDLLTWDGKAWQWVGGHLDADNNVITARVSQVPQNLIVAQTASAPAVVASDLPSGGNIVAEGAELATILFAPGLVPAEDGGINGDPAGLPKPPDGTTAAVYVSLRNWSRPGRANPALVSDALADAKVRATHVKAVAGLVTRSRYAGVQIDYRGLGQDDQAAFADFIAQLADSLHKINKKLVVAVPAPAPLDDGTWDTGGYDWGRIGAAADVIQVDLPADPLIYGKSSAEALVRWAIGEVSRYKLQLGFTSLSVDQAGTDVRFVPFDQALKPFGSVTGPSGAVEPGAAVSVTLSSGAQDVTLDNTSKAYRYTYIANGQTRTVIVGSSESLATVLGWVLRYHLRGVTIHGLLEAGNDPGILAAVQQYAAQTPPAEAAPLQVALAMQGTPIATLSLTQTRFSLTAPISPGNYTLSASIAGTARGQTSIIVGTPVPTPTSPAQTGLSGSTSCLKANYVADVTVPDNTKFDKGAAFTKTWRVQNSGTCDWPADTVLSFVSGRKLGAPDTIPVGAVKMGETKDISVNMKAPNEDAANVAGLWRFKSGSQAFGSLSVVIVAGNPAAATPPPQAPSAAPVASPSSGPTLYGIHAHWGALYNEEAAMDQTANRIAELGLGWTKLQVRWGEEDFFYDCSGNFGFDWNHTNEVINAAGAKGLHVVFSVVTSPPCTHPWTGDVHAPPDDPNVFAAFVGQLASHYAGRGIAIEIWNEQNIDREWHTNPQTLDATRYTQMLAASYNKIKSIDPSIIVISGALAPTGCNNGTSCTDDFTYLQQMKAAGAAQYMDCVGTHVNALRVPPDAGLGGQYDSLFSPPHHSWYFKDTVQGYQSIMGRQACITEFGVASEQNVGSVKGFEWAKDNTEQNQADWVTQGMGLARQYGARMVILWNLDYGPLSGVNDNALYSFYTPSFFKRPVYDAVKNWCASNGCK